MKFLKMLVLVAVLVFCASAGEFLRTNMIFATSADTIVPAGSAKCDYFMVDVDGIVAVTYTDYDSGSITIVIYAYAGIPIMIQNVTCLKRYYTGTTGGTAKCYNSSGSLITNAIRLCKRMKI
jgi:hypothetical protein